MSVLTRQIRFLDDQSHELPATGEDPQTIRENLSDLVAMLVSVYDRMSKATHKKATEKGATWSEATARQKLPVWKSWYQTAYYTYVLVRDLKCEHGLDIEGLAEFMHAISEAQIYANRFQDVVAAELQADQTGGTPQDLVRDELQRRVRKPGA